MNRLILLVLLFVPTIVPAQNFAPFRARYLGSTVHTINQTLTASDTITLTNYGTIYSLSINATIQQPSEGSFVRIVMEDTDGHDYLVAESDRFRNDTTQVSLTAYCEETAMLAGVTPAYLKCYLTNASISIQFLTAALSQANQAPGTTSPNELKRQQVQSIVDRINSYNERHGKLWVAGVTGRAMAEYNGRGCCNVTEDSYLANMIYYIGGIYEIGNPSYAHNIVVDTAYIDSFDWRNRHGKNWITIAKNQESSNWCGVYAAVAGVEAMTNLYFNRNIDLDLSEQDVANTLKFSNRYNSCFPERALDSIAKYGVIDEESFPTTFDSLPAIRPQYLEKVHIRGIKEHARANLTYDSIMHMIINEGPIVSGCQNPNHHHAMLLVGYRKIEAGKRYYMGDEGWVPDTLAADDWRVGQPCLIFKDSYFGSTIQDSYEENGCMYVYFYDINTHFLVRSHSIFPYIERQGHSDSEIVIEDSDGDGYFNWGIGPRPVHCPAWAPNEPDGDDSDFTKGPMNEYGYCMELDSLSKHYIYIDNDTILAMNSPIYNHYVIWNGAEVTITQDLTFNNDTKLIVDKNSTLIIDGATLSNVTLLAQQGSNIVMKNNGKIIHRQTKDFVIPLGSTFELKYGSVQ